MLFFYNRQLEEVHKLAVTDSVSSLHQLVISDRLLLCRV